MSVDLMEITARSKVDPAALSAISDFTAWAMDYTPDELIRWIAFYERMAQQPGTVRAPTGVEALHKARDLLVREAQGAS
jgi:hypothetical protein